MAAPLGATEDYTPYQADPCGYARDVLGQTLTPAQVAVLESVRDHRRTLVEAHHALGKTHIAAVAANWWYDCWPEHIVYVTAPTWPQAKGLTFKELRRQRRAQGLPGQILETGLVRDPDPRSADAHFIRALNADKGEGFQGEHSAPILIILEEGVGVAHYIWEATEGLMTMPECRVLVIGNPTDEATDFGAAAASPSWQTFSFSALDHPNIVAELAGQPAPYPKAVRLLWLREMLEKECEVVADLTEDCFAYYPVAQVERAEKAGIPADPAAAKAVYYKPNAFFQGRVLGIFPTQADAQVVPRAWLAHQPVREPRGPVEIGGDVARFGDDRSTGFVRQGSCVLDGREMRQYDSTAVASAYKELADTWGPRTGHDPQHIPIKIDTTGGLGTGPYDLLRGWGYNAIAVNSSEAASSPDTYPNRRSELWFTTREYARTKTLDLSRLPQELRERLVKELALPRWRNDLKGRKVVESKADQKKRLGASPDLADGLNLAYLAVRTAAPARAGGTRPQLPGNPYRPPPGNPLGGGPGSPFGRK